MIAYFDCSSGISGDMTLGALIDAGVSLQKLKKGLSCLPVKGYGLSVKNVKRAGFGATKIDVEIQNLKFKIQNTRKWKDIEKIIRTSTLSGDIKQKGLSIFKRFFAAEAKVHGEKFDNIHLHELGAVDCIIDIFGALIGLDILGIDKIYSSPLNIGSGNIKTEHGILPVPAPATVELLKDIPVYSSDIKFELTTPTGAALISMLAEGFGPLPGMRIFRVGVGAGDMDFKGHPNVLRVFIGEESGVRIQNPEDRIMVIETNIDDMNPQVYEYVMEKLFKAGALDVFLTPVIMKKGRPGVKLTVLCSKNITENLVKIVFRETTSIGLRLYDVRRETLDRRIMSADTKYGKIRVKVSTYGNDVVKITPEYEDCKKTAKKLDIPLIEVMKAVSNFKPSRVRR